MATKIAIANRKGGVGKTTTALNLAEGLHSLGFRVLLVDLDEQHNSTTQYRAACEGVATVYDLLTSRKVKAKDAIQHSDELGDIIPGDDLITRASEQMTSLDCREFMLSDALSGVDGLYDYIVIDCPPTLGIVTKNALIAADEVIVPVMCDGYSDAAFETLMEQIDVIKSNKRLNPGLRCVSIVITQYEHNTRISREFDNRLPELAERYGARLFNTKVRRCTKAREAADAGVSLYKVAPDCTAALDYKWLVEEYLESSGTAAPSLA